MNKDDKGIIIINRVLGPQDNGYNLYDVKREYIECDENISIFYFVCKSFIKILINIFLK